MTTNPISPANLEATIRIDRKDHDGDAIDRFLSMTRQILEGIAPF